MPIVQNVVKTGAQVAGAVRDLGRLREIVQILGAHGFGFLLEQLNLLPDVSIIRRIKPSATVEELPLPVRAANAIEALGPTFIKLGQVLSTRPDLIPMAWCRAFESLQDNVQPVPYEAIAAQIEASLGDRPEALFEFIDEAPLAAASMAQVHRARLPSGEEVVLKVQRPGIGRVIETDLDILKFLARRVEGQLPDLAILNISGIIKDFEKSIMEESDFTGEAANTERFARNLAPIEGIYVPRVYRRYCSREVLCMEYLKGVKMRQARDEGFDMERLGKIYFEGAARMLFVDGLFHGDLHPGNVLVMEGHRLGLIDFGMAGFLTEEMRDNVCAVLFGISQNDFRTVARVMFEVGIKNTTINYPQFEIEVLELMQRHVVGRSMGEVQVGAFLTDLLQGCLRHNISVPSNYTMLFKAIMTTEGLAKDLLPELDPLEEVRPVLEKAVRQRFSQDRLKRDMAMHVMNADYFLRRLPIIGSQVAADYETGRLKVPIYQTRDPELERRADLRANRVGGAVVLSAFFLGSVWSLGMPQWKPFEIPVVSVMLFLMTGLFGGWLLLGAIRSGGFSSGWPGRS